MNDTRVTLQNCIYLQLILKDLTSGLNYFYFNMEFIVVGLPFVELKYTIKNKKFYSTGLYQTYGPPDAVNLSNEIFSDIRNSLITLNFGEIDFIP